MKHIKAIAHATSRATFGTMLFELCTLTHNSNDIFPNVARDVGLNVVLAIAWVCFTLNTIFKEIFYIILTDFCIRIFRLIYLIKTKMNYYITSLI